MSVINNWVYLIQAKLVKGNLLLGKSGELSFLLKKECYELGQVWVRIRDRDGKASASALSLALLWVSKGD